MARDEKLNQRIREVLKGKHDVTEKKMFGGICFMHRGNMVCGVDKDRLMVRVGPDQYQKALSFKHASVMDFTGVPLKGFVFVDPKGLKTSKSLLEWINMGLKFTHTLPAKAKKTGRASLMRAGRKANSSGPTPLSKIKNFGPVSRAEFKSMGITTLEEVEKLGFEDTCRKYIMYYPERLNANAFLGIICSIENTVWTQASNSQRNAAHAMARQLRAEHGFLPKKVLRR